MKLKTEPSDKQANRKAASIMEDLALYIHVPFCVRKCHYCDFLSSQEEDSVISKYVSALSKEIKHHIKEKQIKSLKTVYIGGGTPTLLKGKQFKQILSLIQHLNPKEITTEANPGTVDTKKIAYLKDLGINRFSLGVQSFNEHHLKILGRCHNSDHAFRTIRDIQATEIENFNIDLMFALPNQTMEEWQSDLKTAVMLGISHISVYNLQIEENTPFHGMKEDLSLPSEDLEAEMYEYAIDFLKGKGFKHYEISNFAKPGFECQHNLIYWQNKQYLGVGLGACSCIEGKRYKNTESLKEYLKTPTSTAKYKEPCENDTLFLGLRLVDGLPEKHFSKHKKSMQKLQKQGLIENIKGKVKLSRKGLLLANLVFEEFI